MIGVFDSGLGGLTILKEIRKKLPQYNYLYLGDTLHVPYGNRSDEAVFDLTKNACDYLFSNGCTLIILACNTASAKALRRLQREYLPEKRKEIGEAINILGVIHPVAEFVAKKAAGKVGVIGTRGTINSKAYVVELKNQRDEIEIVQQATPLLVPLIEEGQIDSVEIVSVLKEYLEELKRKQIKTLILGCTHYPLIIEKIKDEMNGCDIPHPGIIVADSLAQYLDRHLEYKNSLETGGKIEYLVTDYSENFQNMAEKFLGEKINIKKVTLN
jgi:glutamate racemase